MDDCNIMLITCDAFETAFEQDRKRFMKSITTREESEKQCAPPFKWGVKKAGRAPMLIECCKKHEGQSGQRWWVGASEEERNLWPAGGCITWISAPAWRHVERKHLMRQLLRMTSEKRRKLDEVEDLPKQTQTNKPAPPKQHPRLEEVKLVSLKQAPEIASSWKREVMERRCKRCKTLATDKDKICSKCGEICKTEWEKIKVTYVHIRAPPGKEEDKSTVYNIPGLILNKQKTA